MSREDRRRERERFADDTDRWSPAAAGFAILAFILVPVVLVIQLAAVLLGWV